MQFSLAVSTFPFIVHKHFLFILTQAGSLHSFFVYYSIDSSLRLFAFCTYTHDSNMRVSTLALAGFAASVSALSDLDGSVWKALDHEQPVARAADVPRNRPIKRQSGWSPPSDLSAPLKEVWEHAEKTYDGGIEGNKNWGWHQVMRNNG